MRPLVFLRTCALGLLFAASAAACAQGVFAATGPWLDDRGQAFRIESLQSHRSVVSMAYGACRRICSTSLRLLEQLQARADARGEVLNFVIVGLDPSQDRPADWAAYRAEHKLVRANWHFLSGDAKSVAALAQRLGVNYWHYGEHVLHDFRIVLLSAQGLRTASLDTPDQNLATLLP
jgi:protein SCO1